jgi:hypothetical protein
LGELKNERQIEIFVIDRIEKSSEEFRLRSSNNFPVFTVDITVPIQVLVFEVTHTGRLFLVIIRSTSYGCFI